jgi:hypothetical protein
MVTILSSATGRILLGVPGASSFRMEINDNGGVATTFSTGWKYTPFGASTNVTSTTSLIDAKTDWGIWASIFYATSDQRIKKDITPIRDDRALDVMRKIKPVTYQYIDQVSRHGETEYGFIAQDVKCIMPHAVRTECDFIPNVYDVADFSTLTESTTLLTLRTKQNHDVQPNDIIRILDLTEKQIYQTVLDTGISSMVVDGNLQSIVSDYELTEEDIKNNVQKNTVFVYGKQVKDLHTLEKHAVYCVGMAAIQELDRVLSTQRHLLTEQNRMMEEVETQLNQLIEHRAAKQV